MRQSRLKNSERGTFDYIFLLLVAVPLTEFYTWYNCLIREESCNVR